jgi:hypothetical protein
MENAMSITVTHDLAPATLKSVQSSPVLWIAAAAMLIFVVIGCTVSPASFNADDAQTRAVLVGP